jgi:hypothetical protein
VVTVEEGDALHSCSESDERLTFSETQLSDGVRYSTFKVTLHPVLPGQARTSDISDEVFGRGDEGQ